nr:zinc finger, CCHC-type [Tanacetum cinerariifolium]
MFQKNQGESLSEAWTHFKDILQKVPHHGIDLWLQVQIFYDHVTPATRRTIDQSAGAHLALMQPTQVKKITSSCKICSGPHDTQYCIENHEQTFVEYASSRTDEARGLLLKERFGIEALGWDRVASEQDELPSSVGLDSRARSDDGQMYSGNLKVKE